MSELLQPNQIVQSRSGQPCKVLSYLGGGGQGEVYRAQWSGGDFALKWYYPASATSEQRQALEALLEEGKPSDKFLWPEDLADAEGVPGYGYIMRLRPQEFRGLSDLMTEKIKPTFHALITSCIETTKAFRALHLKGLCYRDISFGNVFLDPTTGDVLICDNDNVGVKSVAGGVVGTDGFMAPEIYRHEKTPSTGTDLHSLAVLLFHLLHVCHPLQGRRMLRIRAWDAPARELLFGKEPVFIFDPKDKSNEAVDRSEDPIGEAGANALSYWPLYPKTVKDTFSTAFTDGLRDPDARVTELQWQNTLVALRDSLFKCSCGTPNFYDLESIKASGGTPKVCWSCGKVPKLPFRIRIGKSIVMLNSDAKLYPHHMDDGHPFDFSQAVAEVIQHPTDRNVWGLKNLTSNRWTTVLPTGVAKDVDPGRSVPLAANTKISFGRVEGEIRY